MSRAKREKESKVNLKICVPIICIVVVGITFYMLFHIQNKVNKMDTQNTINSEGNMQNIENELADGENVVQENTIEENTIQNEVNDKIENIPTNNTTTNTVKNSTSNQPSVPAQPGITDQKQKAIELVKKEWGEDDTVSYAFDYINENGEYVIAVKDKASATVKYYFRVNLETETVELD